MPVACLQWSNWHFGVENPGRPDVAAAGLAHKRSAVVIHAEKLSLGPQQARRHLLTTLHDRARPNFRFGCQSTGNREPERRGGAVRGGEGTVSAAA